MTDPETVTGDENVLNVSFQECDVDGLPAEGSQAKDNSLLVKYFAPGFRGQLIGKKAGESFVIQLLTAFEEKERAWIIQDLGLNKESSADAEKYFKMVISKVGLLEKATLDESFFKKVYPSRSIESERDFREAVKQDMADQWKAQTSNNLQHALYHELLDKTQITFPESFLKRWLLNGGEKPKTPDEVENEFPAFSNALKWNLITDKIVTDHKIEVTPEDIREAARKQLFSYLGGLPQGDEQPWVEDYVNKMMQDRRFVEETYQNQRTNKMLHWVETQVKPVDQPITAEAFNKLNEEHKHHHHE
jgi:trigger factor